jgi:hypothetical protein
MKTLTLEIDERAYPGLLNYLRGLSPEQYQLFDDDDALSASELSRIHDLRRQLQAGDEREFEDWQDVRDRL